VLAGVAAFFLLAAWLAPAAVSQLREGAVDSGMTLALPSSGPQTSMEGELRQMSGQAGVIFAGEVLAVRPQMNAAPGAGWVEIEFRIDQAVRGCIGQATYVLREWAGLWGGGQQRYTAGQRLLMLLHTPSASGLSSPVGGQVGAIPLTGAAVAPGPRDRFVAAAEQAVDLRWVETRLLRATGGFSGSTAQSFNGSTASGQRGRVHAGAQLEPVYGGRERPMSKAHTGSRHEGIGAVRLMPAALATSATLPLASPASQGITLRSVLSLLQGWEAEQAHAGQ